MRFEKSWCVGWHRLPLLGGSRGESGLEALSLSPIRCLGGLRMLCSSDWLFSLYSVHLLGPGPIFPASGGIDMCLCSCVLVFLCMWTPEVGVECVCVWHSACGDQRRACGSSFLPLGGSHGSNFGHQVWQQVPLSTEPSHQYFSFCCVPPVLLLYLELAL